MISAFQYQKFGFGYPLKVPYLQTINEYHPLHPKYVDTDTATTILGYTHKEPITMGRNNFCQEFGYGASSKGYLTYDRMVLQVEYCTDTLKALNPGIDLIFLFDHPYGNDGGIEDRLNVTKMNSGYGGSQQDMHPQNIKQEVGYLGYHKKILQAGYDQHMVCQECGNVPFWMTPHKRLAMKFGQYDEPQLKDKKNSDLLGDLKSYGMIIFVVKGKRVGELQDFPHKKSISVTNIIRREKVKGWMGNPKEFCRYYGSTYLWTHPKIYVTITKYAENRIIMIIGMRLRELMRN